MPGSSSDLWLEKKKLLTELCGVLFQLPLNLFGLEGWILIGLFIGLEDDLKAFRQPEVATEGV